MLLSRYVNCSKLTKKSFINRFYYLSVKLFRTSQNILFGTVTKNKNILIIKKFVLIETS